MEQKLVADWETGTLLEIQRLEDQRLGLMIAGDVAGLEKILADELLYGHSSGQIDTKRVFLQMIDDGTLKYISIGSKLDHVVAASAHIMIASGFLKTSAEIGGMRKIVSGRYLAIWRSEENGPQLLALQGSSN
jgi:hypothetical protein